MKQFIVDRHTTPNTPTLEQVPTEKIPIYENRAAVTADLANLSVGQIVATKDTGDELAQPVNVVEEGNLHAVSSNAVAEELNPLKKQYVLESGVISPFALPANGHTWKEITLEHTYSFDNIMFMLTPVSYQDCAFITVTGHWGAHGTSSEELTQSNKLTVFTTNMYSSSQTCGFYWVIYGTKDNIIN